MRLSRNEEYRALASVLEERGIAHDVDHRGRHPAIRFHLGDRSMRVVFSSSPSDGRCRLNAVAFLKRTLRQAYGGSNA